MQRVRKILSLFLHHHMIHLSTNNINPLKIKIIQVLKRFYLTVFPWVNDIIFMKKISSKGQPYEYGNGLNNEPELYL